MAKRRNVVQTIVLNIGDRRSIEQAILQIGGTERELRNTGARDLDTIARYLETRIATPLLRLLRVYPPRIMVGKMRWKSQKQRRYVLMILRKKAKEEGHPEDIRHRRTGAFGDAWVVTFKVNKKRGTISMLVENTAERKNNRTGKMEKIHPFITGNIGLGKSKQSMQRYTKPMQPFHKDRGWQPSAPLVQEYQGKAEVASQEMYEGRLERVIRKKYA